MLARTSEVKVLRDPIHGYVHIDLKVVWDCLNAREFQRLRRIHQLGGDFQVYHTAEHTRFSHSLGVYEIVRRMVREIPDIAESFSEYEKCTAMLAGLLHDIGHGPFSHAFESVSRCRHEEFTQRILLEDSEIHRILAAADPRLPRDIADIIAYRHPNDLLNQLVSGQLDADRMDYLLRDAYFTGTSYGTFDMERILRTIRVRGGRLAVKESGIHSVEDYIMARYHMYWQVYLHPVARSYEIIIAMLFTRMKELWKTQPSFFERLEMFVPFLQETKPDIEDLYLLDESAALYGFALLEPQKKAVVVGGGIGVPPMLQTAKHYGSNATAILGFRDKDKIVLTEDFERSGIRVMLATDDGSAGHHGLVTDLLKVRLEEEKPDIVYACGPKVMLKFVAKMCAEYNVRCQVSLEERMACGVGACLGCATPIRRDDGSVTYLHVCKDGPVFEAERVVFDD